MTSSTPLTRLFRRLVGAGDYELDVDAVAETLLERLVAGRVLAAPGRPGAPGAAGQVRRTIRT